MKALERDQHTKIEQLQKQSASSLTRFDLQCTSIEQ